MKLQTKKELLRYKSLNNRIDYDPEISYLLYWADMDDEIDRINDKSFSYEVELQGNEITCYQFLKYTNEFIRYMKHYFYNMSSFSMKISEIIKSSKDEFNALLDCKLESPYFIYGLKENKEIREKINKLIIASFIKNAKYVPFIKETLENCHIELKNIDDYNLKESEKIVNLLSGIVFSNRGKGNINVLFENIEKHTESYIQKLIQNKKLKTTTIEDKREKYIDGYISHYNTVLKAYNARKKYLKYFV